ncbi:PAS domain-containing protein [Rubrivirga sp.]|uniref:PAS domain-containing protein n=1 Tax=Rubrivirga sp. TaxID=1885344 RepID=UPI003B525B82
MLSPTPAVRAALFGLVVVTAVAVAGAALHLGAVSARSGQALAAALDARVHTVALLGAGLAPVADAGLPETLSRYGADGRLVETTDAERAGVADWFRIAGADGAARVVETGGLAYAVASADLASGGRLVAVAPAPTSLPDGALLRAALATASLWGVLVGVLVVMTWVAGPRTAHQLALLGERIAQGQADGDALIRHAGLQLGPFADAFQPVADRFRALGRQSHDVQQHVAALYQINPHYVLLCSLDGEIVEANPAFYAATGLPIEAVRGGRVEALRETFPVEPLMELARRSLREGSAITGVEYALIGRDDETRPVEVALRGFELEGREMVLFQATDQAHQKQLERRVAAFTDTLDLMVDQRVHQLSAGQEALRRVLDAAGVVVASFDAGGATSRWNGAATALTGQPLAGVPHFAAATQVLGLSPTERTAFTQWFWSPSQEPFIGRHGVVGRDGETRTRQLIWQRVDADMAGRSDLRTLVGVEVPAYVGLPGPSGDGVAGAAVLV